jgi:hypothetical protein
MTPNMADTQRFDADDVVPDDRPRAHDVVGDEGGASQIGSPKRNDVGREESPPPVTPDSAEGERDANEQSR